MCIRERGKEREREGLSFAWRTFVLCWNACYRSEVVEEDSDQFCGEAYMMGNYRSIFL
jgi:hypothetical protein